VVDARLERYAELLLDTCLGVQRGWQVMVWSTPWARPLLEEVMRQLGIRGAYPLLRLTFSGGLLYHRAWLAHAPLEVISKPASIDVYALDSAMRSSRSLPRRTPTMVPLQPASGSVPTSARGVRAPSGAHTGLRGLASTATTCLGFCAGIRRPRSPRTPE
jgi:leucyl aminopeptidase (aminopeptidase T)